MGYAPEDLLAADTKRDFRLLLLLTACTQDLSERLATTHLAWAVADDVTAYFTWIDQDDSFGLEIHARDRVEASCSDLNPQQVSFQVTDQVIDSFPGGVGLVARVRVWKCGAAYDTGCPGGRRWYTSTAGSVTLTRVEPCTSDGLGALDVALANIVLERDGPGQRTVEAFTWTAVPVARMSNYDGE